MKPHDLPELYKIYTMFLSSGGAYQIDGQVKNNIMNSKSQFIELNNGSCVNKSFIVQIRFDHESTTDNFRKQPKSVRESLTNQIEKK